MIREANLPDAEAIAGIIVETWKFAYTGIVEESYSGNLPLQKFVRIMSDNLLFKKETVFVHECNGKISGFISGKLSGEEKGLGEIIGFYVLPEYQRAGTGRSLFQHMKDFFFREGCRRISLWTLKGAGNNSFYRKNGGKAAEEKPVKIGEKEYDGIRFVFELEAGI